MPKAEEKLAGSQMSFPLRVENGTFKTVSGIEALEEAIIDVIETEQGERVMRPEYGWPIRDLIADGDVDEIIAAIRVALTSQNHLPIDHSRLLVKATPTDIGRFDIAVTYSVPQYDDAHRTVTTTVG